MTTDGDRRGSRPARLADVAAKADVSMAQLVDGIILQHDAIEQWRKDGGGQIREEYQAAAEAAV
ncbi:hypothetical protein [Parenemella sanctibonifatiensis]|uniref:hypothetical protein n=1 Tax=Parenemella sanctibonifatiensis TaxID=2016505 RepID=UPI0011857684|nr:hypothetical protein [Parenemella sanctibonifatiensis]